MGKASRKKKESREQALARRRERLHASAAKVQLGDRITADDAAALGRVSVEEGATLTSVTARRAGRDLAVGGRGLPTSAIRKPDLGTRIGVDAEGVTGKPGIAYPFIPDDNGDIHMERIEVPRGIGMSTPTLANLSVLAQAHPWCGRALSDEDIRRLDPTGTHVILTAFKHTTEDWKRDNARVHMYLKLRGQAEPHERMVDLPSRQFGIFLQAIDGHGLRTNNAGAKLAGLGFTLDMPSWAAGRSFPKVWDAAEFNYSLFSALQVNGTMLASHVALALDVTEDDAKHLEARARMPRAVIGAAALKGLAEARLIVSEPEWVQGLDTFKTPEEGYAYASEAKLPFDTIYLDCEGPGGMLPVMPVKSTVSRENFPVRVAGALMWHEGEALNIMPFGYPSMDRPDDGPGSDTTAYEPLGRLVVSGVRPKVDEHGIAIATIGVDGGATSIESLIAAPPEGFHGRIDIPVMGAYYRDGSMDSETAQWMARAVYECSMKCLRMIYMLQGANVELVEAKLHNEGRRRMKRADKRGWPIEVGLQVAVAWKKKMYLRPPGTETIDPGDTRMFSHAFWVSGHAKFYALGTRMADALADSDPTKLVEDPTTLNRGLGRIIFCPPFIKGLTGPDGEDRTPVEKVRRIAGDPYADAS